MICDKVELFTFLINIYHICSILLFTLRKIFENETLANSPLPSQYNNGLFTQVMFYASNIFITSNNVHNASFL